jgi:hypothetical protein
MVEMSTAKSPQYENAQASEVEAQNPQTADVQVRNKQAIHFMPKLNGNILILVCYTSRGRYFY